MLDPLDVIAEICHDQPHDALEQIARALGFGDPQEGKALTDERIDALAMRSCGVLHGDVLHMGRKQRIAFARAIERELRGAQESREGEQR